MKGLLKSLHFLYSVVRNTLRSDLSSIRVHIYIHIYWYRWNLSGQPVIVWQVSKY